MENIQASPFKLREFIVKHFEIDREPGDQGNVIVDINPSGIYNSQDKDFMLSLDLNLKDENETFQINMTSYGYFEFKNIDNAESLSDYFCTNAPAIIFPYIRAYISTVTALSGLKTINLPIMNLSRLKEDLKRNIITAGDDEDAKLLN